jgi:hypothetical protein
VKVEFFHVKGLNRPTDMTKHVITFRRYFGNASDKKQILEYAIQRNFPSGFSITSVSNVTTTVCADGGNPLPRSSPARLLYS